MRTIDEPCASDMPIQLAGTEGLWATFLRLIRSRRNRVKVARLDTMSDHELFDIGLTRSDLHSALNESRFFEDPSAGLVRRARRRGP